MSREGSPPGLDGAELRRLAKLYYLESYLFEEVSGRFQQERTLTDREFFSIVVWKSNRAKTKIKRGLAAVEKSVGQLMREVYEAETPEEKVESLLGIWGIGLAMASAILTVCYPTQFTVLDYRAWEALRAAAVEGLPNRYPQSTEQYLDYCEVCGRLAERAGLSLRDLDRALWAKSWEDDLSELTDG